MTANRGAKPKKNNVSSSSGKRAGAKSSSAKQQKKRGAVGLTPDNMRTLRVLTGTVAGILAVYILVALISYLFSWTSDQSLFTDSSMMDSDVLVSNKGGKFGLKLARFFVSRLFGLAAFSIPFLLAAVSARLLRIKKINLFRLFVITFLGTIIFSVLFAFIGMAFGGENHFSNGPGGEYGASACHYLTNVLGWFGALCVILFALFLWITLLSRKVAFWFDDLLYNTSHREKADGRRSGNLPDESAGSLTGDSDESFTGSFTESFTEEEDEDYSGIRSSGQVSGRENQSAGGASDCRDVDSGNLRDDAGSNVKDGGGSFEFEEDEFNKPLDYIDDDGPVEIAGDDAASSQGGQTEGIPDDGGNGDGPAGEPSVDDSVDSTGGGEDGEGGGDSSDVRLVVDDNGGYKPDGVLTAEELDHLYNPRLDLPDFKMPSLSMLLDYRDKWYEVSRDELEKNKQRIVDALANYKIKVVGITAKMGPTVTLYKIHLAEGIKIAQVRRLEEDIAITLGTKGVRVVTLRDSAGIEVPNEKASVVPLKGILSSPQFKETRMELPLALGITVTNEPFFLDLAKMPHLLVAGATGMGKSVGLNCIITSLLYTKHPTELKFVLVDPKMVEFSLYSKLEKHYLAMLPDAEEAIITDTKKVVNTLKSLCIEMDDRYTLLKMAGVRQLKDYNSKFLERRLNPCKGHKFLPYIVVIVDEFADLLMTAGREVEEPIARLAQKARAVGIHLVIATQRPTTNIITGMIKANFNARIAFYVNTMVDSRTILDTPGANRLIGRGDMLVMHPGSDLTRVQCALVDTNEIIDITESINSQRGYPHAFYLPEYVDENEEQSAGDVDMSKRDKFFEEAAKIVVQYQQGSTSLLQRKLNVGYNRAGRIIDQLEAAGIVGPFEGSKARAVLISDFDTLDRKIQSLDHQMII